MATTRPGLTSVCSSRSQSISGANERAPSLSRQRRLRRHPTLCSIATRGLLITLGAESVSGPAGPPKHRPTWLHGPARPLVCTPRLDRRTSDSRHQTTSDYLPHLLRLILSNRLTAHHTVATSSPTPDHLGARGTWRISSRRHRLPAHHVVGRTY
jgi:hypothetical protein